MKREMERWDARRRLERRARMFGAGCVLLMVAMVWMWIVRPALTQYGIGGGMFAVGAVLLGAATRR